MKSAQKSARQEGTFYQGYRYWVQFVKEIPNSKLLFSIVLGLFRVGISTLWPYLLYTNIKNIGTYTFSEIIGNLTWVVLLLILGTFISQHHSKVNVGILKVATHNLIVQIWKKIHALDWLTFKSKNRVYFFDTMMVEAWRVRAGKSALLETLFVNSFIAAALCLLIAVISMPLFLMCLCVFTITALGYYLSSLQIRPLHKKFHAAWRDQHLWIAKSIDQFDLVKMDRAYQESLQEHNANTNTFLTSNAKVLMMQARWKNINQLISNFARIVVFVVGVFAFLRWLDHIGR